MPRVQGPASPRSTGLRDRLREFADVGGEPRFFAAAALVGLLTGTAAIGFAALIGLVQRVAIGAPDLALYLVPELPSWRVLLVPTVGGLLVGIVTHTLASEAQGHGVPAVMEAVALRGGRMRRRIAFVKALTSALTIGTGGSVGREGPIVQIGAGVGSAIGQALTLPADRLRTLTAAGAAGGIAAAFNAPIAGAFFALEVIARNFAAPTFAPVVLCAVFATMVSRLWFGAAPAFVVPPLIVGATWETALALPLGLVCSLIAVVFMSTLEALEAVFERLPFPRVAKPALGGLLVGGLILVRPELYGIGHETMDAALASSIPWTTLALLLCLKPLATSLTLSSGGSGGVFLPSLYLGALVGGLFGLAVPHLLPAAQTSSGAWALVGMAGVLSATSFAPVTGALLAFELTHDYALILPILATTAVSTLMTRALRRDSIYTRKLSERGIDLDQRDDLALRGVRVGDVMQAAPPAVTADAPLDVVLARFLDSNLGAVFVTSPDGHLLGQVSIHDVKTALADPTALGGIVVAGDVSERTLSTGVDDNVADALEHFSRDGRDVSAVIDAEGLLVGALSLRSVMDVFAREALRGDYVGVGLASGGDGTRGREALRLSAGAAVRTYRVPDAWVGRSLRELDVRSRWRVSVIALRRGGIDAGVDPGSAFASGEQIVVMGVERDLDRFATGVEAHPAA